jgi:hypothetical protein
MDPEAELDQGGMPKTEAIQWQAYLVYDLLSKVFEGRVTDRHTKYLYLAITYLALRKYFFSGVMARYKSN